MDRIYFADQTIFSLVMLHPLRIKRDIFLARNSVLYLCNFSTENNAHKIMKEERAAGRRNTLMR